MPLTENELRDLLHQRTAGAPASPDRVGAVRARVAKQRRRELAGVAAVMAVVVGAGVLWALPRNTAAPIPPATSSPTPSDTAVIGEAVVTISDVAGLSTTVGGRRAVSSTKIAIFELEVTNPGAEAWTGSIGAGALVEASVPGLYEGGIINPGAGVDPEEYSGFGATLDSPNQQLQGVILTDSVTLAPGETRRWSFDVQRDAAYPVDGAVLGWAPYANNEATDDDQITPVAGLDALTFTPVESNLSCATVQIGSWERGEVQPWTVDLAYTAVVGADGKATWEEIAGLGDQGTSVTSTQTSNVRSSTVMRALADRGAAEASGFGAELPDRPATLDPGRYVAYSGTQLVPITFAGSCGPSGEPISGTWTAYNDRDTGLLDCATAALSTPTELAGRAYALCPKG